MWSVIEADLLRLNTSKLQTINFMLPFNKLSRLLCSILLGKEHKAKYLKKRYVMHWQYSGTQIATYLFPFLFRLHPYIWTFGVDNIIL